MPFKRTFRIPRIAPAVHPSASFHHFQKRVDPTPVLETPTLSQTQGDPHATTAQHESSFSATCFHSVGRSRTQSNFSSQFFPPTRQSTSWILVSRECNPKTRKNPTKPNGIPSVLATKPKPVRSTGRNRLHEMNQVIYVDRPLDPQQGIGRGQVQRMPPRFFWDQTRNEEFRKGEAPNESQTRKLGIWVSHANQSSKPAD